MPLLAHQDAADPSRGDSAFHGAGFGTDVRTRTTWSRGKAWHQMAMFWWHFFLGKPETLRVSLQFSRCAMLRIVYADSLLFSCFLIRQTQLTTIQPLRHDTTSSPRSDPPHWSCPIGPSDKMGNCFPYKMVEANEQFSVLDLSFEGPTLSQTIGPSAGNWPSWKRSWPYWPVAPVAQRLARPR